MTAPNAPVTVAELKKFAIFSDLEGAEIVNFLRTARVRSYGGDRRIVFKQGAPGDGMYVILSGEVEISYADNSGRRHPVGTLGESDYFGEMSLLDAGPRAAHAETRGDARLIFLSRDAFLELRQTDALALNKILLRMLAEMSGRLRSLGHRYVQSKSLLAGF